MINSIRQIGPDEYEVFLFLSRTTPVVCGRRQLKDRRLFAIECEEQIGVRVPDTTQKHWTILVHNALPSEAA